MVRLTAETLAALSTIAVEQGDLARAAVLLEEALDLSRNAGDTVNVAYFLRDLARITLQQEQYRRAISLVEESMAISATIGYKGLRVTRLQVLSTAELRTGTLQQAREHLKEMLTVAQSSGLPYYFILLALLGWAELALAERQAVRSVCLLSAIDHFLRQAGQTWQNYSPYDRSRYTAACTAAKTLLGEPAYTQAWATGQAMTQQQAMAYTLDETSPDAAQQQIDTVGQGNQRNRKHVRIPFLHVDQGETGVISRRRTSALTQVFMHYLS